MEEERINIPQLLLNLDVGHTQKVMTGYNEPRYIVGYIPPPESGRVPNSGRVGVTLFDIRISPDLTDSTNLARLLPSTELNGYRMPRINEGEGGRRKSRRRKRKGRKRRTRR